MGSGRGDRCAGALRLDTPAGSARPCARRGLLACARRLRLPHRPRAARLGRWSHTPDPGIYHAVTDSVGNILVPEDRIRSVMERAGGDPAKLAHEMALALGEAWDEELDAFRHAGEGAPVRWLTKVG